VLYTSMIQDSYFCTHAAASKPILVSVPLASGSDSFQYTGKRPEGAKLVLSTMVTISTVVHP